MLTGLEKKIISFISEYLRENEGASPTLSEIGEGCGITSVGTVHRYIASIEQKGFLKKSKSGWRALMAPTELPFRGVIAAGSPVEAIEQNETIDIGRTLIQPDCFVLEVSGDSMIDAGIFHGDLAIIKQSNTAKNGDIVVALIDNQEATLKEFKRSGGGRNIQLIPHNESLKVQNYNPERVLIQGILKSVVRHY